MTQEEYEKIKSNPEILVRYVASQRFATFARYINPKLVMTPFHKVYYEVLDRFAHKKIKRLIVSCPPQIGKSEASSRLLPSFLLGYNPDNKIVICSYNADQAKSFNQDVQKIVKSEAYKNVFPLTRFNDGKARMDNVYKCNSDVSEVIGYKGFVRGVGRNGALTGKSVDIAILDDVYKDYNEANSSLIREQAWKWYTTVVRTRLHNDSQEIIVFTRWHEDDLVGKLEKSGERIIEVHTWEDIEKVGERDWVHLNFPALKETAPTELDGREVGEALWEEKHSRVKLLEFKSLDPVQFQCLYQGNPSSADGRLYGTFKTYSDKSEYGAFIRRGCLIDVASSGTDYLCSIQYDVYRSPNMMYNEKTKRFEPLLFALVTDIIFTQEGTEITSVSVPNQINMFGSQRVWCESNNGGEQFGKNIAKKVKAHLELYHTSTNKEAKIVSNSAFVSQSIIMPFGWESKFPRAYEHLTHFLRVFSANTHDDIEDVLTEIYLKEIAGGNTKPYGSQRRGIRRAN